LELALLTLHYKTGLMQREVKITDDGSATLFVPELGEHYHSTFGAVQESLHVFIHSGLMQLSIKTPSIFEVGFGTGLNALLTLLKASLFESINYCCIDPWPVELETIRKLNYQSSLKLNQSQSGLFEILHTTPWDADVELTSSFHFTKFRTSFSDFEFKRKFDLIYFDAFAPWLQPELWEEEVFQKLYDSMNPGGILVTYCAKGEVRRKMKRCGFQVERLPGPPGKREMLRSTIKMF
jgi:tRNA U34 5-methylaminomethyl-2-thiouridine-forming methyltransferase MnmC